MYLDYTGGRLYAESQLRQHIELLSDNVFGNPHSTNPTSPAMTNLVEQARTAVLEYFEGFEDGTLSYLALPAVEIGLKHIQNIGIDRIHERVRCLTGCLLESLLALRHSNGMPVVHICGPTTPEKRGGTIAFNVYDPAGKRLDCYRVQEEANSWKISLRSGCFCNPGLREITLAFAENELMPCFLDKEQVTYSQFLEKIDSRLKEGALRISVGLVTNFADVCCFLQFIQGFVDTRTT